MKRVQPGDVLAGKYRVIDTLGSGGVATVLEVAHLTLPGRRYAAKLLQDGHTASPRVVERLVREAQLAATLDHPGIVAIHDVEDDPERGLVIVMEKLEGAPLAAVLSARRLELATVQVVGLGLLDALAHAHGAGVVHRDIKPGNVMVVREPDGTERLKVVDFGIAGGDVEGTLTGVGEVWGTPRFASPEHMRGLHAVTPQSDLFSVGVTLFVACRGPGLPMIYGASDASIGRAIEGSELPPPWAGFFRRALAMDPTDRFADAEAMARALAALPVPGPSRPLLDRPLAPRTDLSAGYPQTWTGAHTPDATWEAGRGATQLPQLEAPPLGERKTELRQEPLPPAPPPRRRRVKAPESAGVGRLVPWLLVGLLGTLLLAALGVAGLSSGLLLSADPLPQAPQGQQADPRSTCLLWADALWAQQDPSGGFSGIAQAPVAGWDTAQHSAALAAADTRCGPAPDGALASAGQALLSLSNPSGWAGVGSTGAPEETLTVATAWALEALRRLPDSEQHAHEAARRLAALQHADGTWPWHGLPPEADRPHVYATVVALWALGPEGTVVGQEARERGLGALKTAWLDPTDPWSLHATDGLDEQAFVALSRARALDGEEAAIAAFARRSVGRCALSGGSCTRAPYTNHSVSWETPEGEDWGIVMQWLPWATLAAGYLQTTDLPPELTAEVAAMEASLLHSLVDGGATWAGRPGYELSEHLLALTEQVR